MKFMKFTGLKILNSKLTFYEKLWDSGHDFSHGPCVITSALQDDRLDLRFLMGSLLHKKEM